MMTYTVTYRVVPREMDALISFVAVRLLAGQGRIVKGYRRCLPERPRREMKSPR